MLSRRNFLGGLISIPALFAPSLFSKATTDEYYNGLGNKLASMASYDNPIKYKGWNIYRWTGWKASQVDDSLVGQWIATDLLPSKYDYIKQYGKTGQVHKQHSRYLYSSSPGYCSVYRKGEPFDIARHGYQIQITNKSTEQNKDIAIYSAYQNITKLIDSIRDGSFGPWPSFWEPRSFYSK
jgi:hypothetical protein